MSSHAQQAQTLVEALPYIQKFTGKTIGIFGKISVENGRYRSMGQNLLVETGEVRFSGTPDSGLINVQAIRNPTTIDDDVKAGIKVYGPIQKPKVSVFSEPELDESEALSYILRGHGTDGESDTGSLAKSMMISASAAPSIAKTKPNDIKSTLLLFYIVVFCI